MKLPFPDNSDLPLTPGPEPTTTTPVAPPVIDSASLLKGRREVRIDHGSCIYTLRLTRGDKLILTK